MNKYHIGQLQQMLQPKSQDQSTAAHGNSQQPQKQPPPTDTLMASQQQPAPPQNGNTPEQHKIPQIDNKQLPPKETQGSMVDRPIQTQQQQHTGASNSLSDLFGDMQTLKQQCNEIDQQNSLAQRDLQLKASLQMQNARKRQGPQHRSKTTDKAAKVAPKGPQASQLQKERMPAEMQPSMDIDKREITVKKTLEQVPASDYSYDVRFTSHQTAHKQTIVKSVPIESQTDESSSGSSDSCSISEESTQFTVCEVGDSIRDPMCPGRATSLQRTTPLDLCLTIQNRSIDKMEIEVMIQRLIEFDPNAFNLE